MTYLDSAQKTMQAKIPFMIDISFDELGPEEFISQVHRVGSQAAQTTSARCRGH